MARFERSDSVAGEVLAHCLPGRGRNRSVLLAAEGDPRHAPEATLTDVGTVTTADRGDPHAPVYRYVALVRETETLRGFDTWSIAPTYLEEIQQRILDGMETELIDPIATVEDIMENYLERCVQVCVSGHLAIWLHDTLPFGLAILDDRIGLGVRDPETRELRAFIDTDAPAARKWTRAAYNAYKADAVRLDDFAKKGPPGGSGD